MRYNKHSEEELKQLEEEFIEIILYVDKFPSYYYLKNKKRYDLINFIDVYKGGKDNYAKELDIPIKLIPPYYWYKKENIQYEIKNNIKELNDMIFVLGRFPTKKEIKNYKPLLLKSILKTGKINRYRRLCGFREMFSGGFLQKNSNIIGCLQKIVDKIHRFPTHDIIQKVYGNGILLEMQRRGGLNVYRNAMGFSSTTRQNISLYSKWRGEIAERIAGFIIDRICKLNNMTVIKNKRFSDGSIVEFYLIDNGTNATACIDITATSKYCNIIEKWTNRNYYRYANLLFIVVFSDTLISSDYDLLNSLSPKNVYVMNIIDFVESFKYSYDIISKEDIKLFESVSFDNYIKIKGD